MKVSVLIPAAGSGRRMGGEIEKQFMILGDRPIVAHTLQRFQASDLIEKIYLIVPEGRVEYCREEVVIKYGLSKVTDIVIGGKERQDSVYYGLKRVNADGDNTDLIMIHDSVRPFFSERMICESIESAQRYGSVVVAVPEKDTIKEISDDMLVCKTISRESLWRIQTPQTFCQGIITSAFQRAVEEGYYGTDESSLVERAGWQVRVILGSYLNIKITDPEDLLLGEMILKRFNFIV
ncbi:MAG: 2-C-methyl-D-erythritol 4-phosphate cytidylyltransferase [Nitrospinae bacterium]|nr:2-C-methyl-D-erythritol 4-phosphate cytidylyltransferase [Nitrospinota bacterium]